MKKILLSIAVLTMASTSVISCGSDDSTAPIDNGGGGNGGGGNGGGGGEEPITVGLNQILIDGELYTADGSYFTVFGDQTTGEIQGTYTWTPEESGLEVDVLASEWYNFQIMNRDGDSYYYTVTMFDVPMESETVANLPGDVTEVWSYAQRLYYVPGAQQSAQVVYQTQSQTESTKFTSFTLGNFGQTESGDPVHEVTAYDFKTFFAYDEVLSQAQFSGQCVLYVEVKTSGKSKDLNEKFEKANQYFDLNKFKK